MLPLQFTDYNIYLQVKLLSLLCKDDNIYKGYFHSLPNKETLSNTIICCYKKISSRYSHILLLFGLFNLYVVLFSLLATVKDE